MNYFRFFCLLVLGAGCTDSPSSPPNAASPFQIFGQVISSTNSMSPPFQITMGPTGTEAVEGEQTFTSDSAGKFSIPTPGPGCYRLDIADSKRILDLCVSEAAPHLDAGTIDIWKTFELKYPVMNAMVAFAGNTLLIGGGSGREIPSTVATLDPFPSDRLQSLDISTGKLTDTTLISGERQTAGAGVRVGQKIFFAGGVTFLSSALQATAKVNAFDLTSGTWSLSTPFPHPTPHVRAAATTDGYAVFLSNRYCPGGAIDASCTPTSQLRVYDSTSDTWSTANLPTPRASTIVAHSNKVYIAGGYATPAGSNPQLVNRIDILEPSSGTLTYLTLPDARVDIAATTAGSKILFAGGIRSNEVATNRVDIYDTSTHQWSQGQLSKERLNTVPASNGTIAIFVGGHAGLYRHWEHLRTSSRIDIFDSTTNEWSLATLPIELRDVSIAVSGNKAYIVGGTTRAPLHLGADEVQKSLFVFDFSSKTLVPFFPSM